MGPHFNGELCARPPSRFLSFLATHFRIFRTGFMFFHFRSCFRTRVFLVRAVPCGTWAMSRLTFFHFRSSRAEVIFPLPCVRATFSEPQVQKKQPARRGS